MSKDYTTTKKIMLVIGISLIVIGIIFALIGFTSFPTKEDVPNIIEDSPDEFHDKSERRSEKNQKAMTF